ncbi:MAG: hypothetical protein OEX04_02055 [Acidimicrobiia bacterium]|nr:hypothetical protein [Acidimicrobiia bacterium]MDH5292748.1 hypothetical protein [Acidimicrobiia bacterium]
MRRSLIVMTAACLALTACDRAAEPELTTTTSGVPEVASSIATETTEAGPDTTAAPETTPTTQARVAVDGYEVQVATTQDEGRVLWVTIAPEDYTDRDLEDFVGGVVDSEDAIWEFHVLDDVAAVDAVRVPEADRTEEEQQLVDDHYLVSVTEGNVVTFRGPFESAGSFVLGS